MPYLQREEDRKPAHHPCALRFHCPRVRGECDGAVERSLEVAGEAVHGAAVGEGKGDVSGAGVVFVIRLTLVPFFVIGERGGG